jgi:sirohydrochlorin ferrochelatase
VALCDHGSPKREVAAVRDALAMDLAELLGDEVEALAAASMERREGDEYDFNEPLLDKLLRRPGWNHGDVVISMLFLSPGRHAGPGGDIDTICKTAEAESPGLRTYMTGLVGDHPDIVPLLKRRLEMERVRI